MNYDTYIRKPYDDEPPSYGKCEKCGSDIFRGDEILIHNDSQYCEKECLLEQMLKDGDIERVVAGDDTVRIV